MANPITDQERGLSNPGTPQESHLWRYRSKETGEPYELPWSGRTAAKAWEDRTHDTLIGEVPTASPARQSKPAAQPFSPPPLVQAERPLSPPPLVQAEVDPPPRGIDPTSRATDRGATPGTNQPTPATPKQLREPYKPEAPPSPPTSKPQNLGDTVGSAMKDEASKLAAIELRRREEEARGLLDRFGKGKRVTQNELRDSARGLAEAAHRAADADVISPESLNATLDALANNFGSNLDEEIKRIRASPRGGEDADETYLNYLQVQRTMSERLRQFLGGATGVGIPEMIDAAGEIRRSQLKNELNSAKRKNEVGEVYADYLAIGMVGIGRTDQLLGRGSGSLEEIMGDATKLANIHHVPMVMEARDVIARAKSGERFNERYVEMLEDRLTDPERDRRYRDDGPELAKSLLEVQLSWLKADMKEAALKVGRGEQVPEPYLDYLNDRAVAMGLKKKDLESEGELKRSPM